MLEPPGLAVPFDAVLEVADDEASRGGARAPVPEVDEPELSDGTRGAEGSVLDGGDGSGGEPSGPVPEIRFNREEIWLLAFDSTVVPDSGDP